ncbi:hypothetical protein [Parasphingorhabdus sp.]|uniref:hypothetical protein n=1 Tax=Parasphingorhabdus sp. TaxID=2709688 RepID=UPI003A8D1A7F
MMAERATLISARRESEDNLVKNIITLSSGLVALMAGFVGQLSVNFSTLEFVLFSFSIGILVFAIIAGMAESYFSSKAYLAQQVMVEEYYSRIISKFEEPKANRFVRISQIISFVLFVIALISLAALAVSLAKDNSNVRQTEPTTTTPSATTTPSTVTD